MPDFFGNKSRREINDGYWLRQSLQNGIPADCIYPYRKLLNSFIEHYKNLIDSIITEAGGKITFPMETALFENYLDGFQFEYRPFSIWLEPNKDKEGYWAYDPQTNEKVIIFYNAAAPEYRQRHTKVHELFHFAQTLDRNILKFIDEIIFETKLPPFVINKLVERSTDKATAMYLMPNRFFKEKYEEIVQVQKNKITKANLLKELARYFNVSVESAGYRLNECGIYVPA